MAESPKTDFVRMRYEDMNIGTVANQSGVPAKTIRYYESVGLIPPASRSENGYRRYSKTDVETLRFIQRARSLGFSVEDVTNLLALWRDNRRTSAQVRDFARRHVARIEEKILELESILGVLEDLIARCHGDDRPECPILEEFERPSAHETPLRSIGRGGCVDRNRWSRPAEPISSRADLISLSACVGARSRQCTVRGR